MTAVTYYYPSQFIYADGEKQCIFETQTKSSQDTWFLSRCIIPYNWADRILRGETSFKVLPYLFCIHHLESTCNPLDSYFCELKARDQGRLYQALSFDQLIQRCARGILLDQDPFPKGEYNVKEEELARFHHCLYQEAIAHQKSTRQNLIPEFMKRLSRHLQEISKERVLVAFAASNQQRQRFWRFLGTPESLENLSICEASAEKPSMDFVLNIGCIGTILSLNYFTSPIFQLHEQWEVQG